MTGIDENIERLTKRRTYRARRSDVTASDVKLLEFIADGKGSEWIAKQFGVSKGAIERERFRLYIRIGVHNAAHAVAWAFRNRYLHIESLDDRYKKAMHDLTGHDE